MRSLCEASTAILVIWAIVASELACICSSERPATLNHVQPADHLHGHKDTGGSHNDLNNASSEAVAVHSKGSAQYNAGGARRARRHEEALEPERSRHVAKADSEYRERNVTSQRSEAKERTDRLSPSNRPHENLTAHQRQSNLSTQHILNFTTVVKALEADVPDPQAKTKWLPDKRAIFALVIVNILALFCITTSTFAYMSAWPFSLYWDSSLVDRVQGYALSDRFFGNFIYSIVLPDSFGLSTTLSQGATYSGWIIGIYKGLSLVGLGISLILCSVRNPAWVRNIYPCIVTGKIMAFVGSLMFFLLIMYRDFVPHANHWILFSRALAGTGYGIGMIPVELIFVHTTTPEERPAMLSAAVFNVTLGIGLGPLFASVTRRFFYAMTGTNEGAMEAVMCLPLTASLVSLVAVYFVARGEEYIEVDKSELEEASSDWAKIPFTEEVDYWPRRIAILSCAVVVGIRAAVCAGLEAATAMILETDYQWSLGTVGIAIGLSFMLSVPGRLIFLLLKNRLSVVDSIRLNMLGSLIASVFLFKGIEDLIIWDRGGSPLALLFAGSILYCAIYQVSGLIEGIMTTFALPAGSYFTVDNVIMLKLVMLDSVGRTFGPPLARMLVEAGGKEYGQGCYAWQQLAMTLLAALITEAVLLRSMESIQQCRRMSTVSYTSTSFSDVLNYEKPPARDSQAASDITSIIQRRLPSLGRSSVGTPPDTPITGPARTPVMQNADDTDA